MLVTSRNFCQNLKVLPVDVFPVHRGGYSGNPVDTGAGELVNKHILGGAAGLEAFHTKEVHAFPEAFAAVSGVGLGAPTCRAPPPPHSYHRRWVISLYKRSPCKRPVGYHFLAESGPDARATQGKVELARHPLTDHHCWTGGQAALLQTTTFGDPKPTSTKLLPAV
eukprot:gene25322-biopygen7481